MFGVPADNAALESLKHYTGVLRNGILVGERQTQVRQAVQGIPTKATVEIQDTMTYDKTGLVTFPNIIAQIAKVTSGRLNS